MYADDSFHTLSLTGRIGLVCLSLGLAALILWLAWRGTARVGLAARLLIVGALFFSFVWLSPQVYYTYYLILFDGLPWQVVINTPPGPASLLDLLTFREAATLSAHAQGMLGWALIAMAGVRQAAGGFGSSAR